ncbi:DUF262 domain-containing protein [Mucilaginibacter phyllosphaerae]|uniref:DUF262 domain-containing protein n=1 Tax=Mucilaginibacter phyllosphaerae TaxID=1812349 RepID=A0A4Y8AA03_9SPHI|nr:DUF262 domain-containing protein [Mucilaginibacter phyllosphaerae]MBB3969913.1 uncharacterized protein with ParB-like and HNH nuclease domain [Mucilaginibacter phyllosphaerae]TEW65287.1 DUF262 domain-containing protein [Mucilaginibacter phyllosphaerae]GGH16837.1 hypothetical protein GCM10007352_26500 [Mucilaginibacter phyllosphaerae]
MAQKIESEKLLVKEVFTKWFRIPEYQRPYVWSNDQISELLDDVMQACTSNPDSDYFLGSMVLQKKEKIEGGTKYTEYDLLDGQQRLTTLFLITAVIRDLTPPTSTARLQSSREAIFQIANDDDNIPERIRIVFDIRSQVKDFINEFVKDEGGTKKKTELLDKANNPYEDTSIRNMANAIVKIHEYFIENDVNAFYKYLRSNVLMIYVSAEQLEDAFRMFTIMNNRGVKLRNSDILKAENLGQITNATIRMDLAKKWEETETYFGEDFDAFLSYLRTILVKQKATVSLLKEFEDSIYNPKVYDRNTKTYSKIPALLNKGEDTFKFIDKYKKHYEQLFDNDNYNLTNSFEVHNYLHLMEKGFEADFWIAPLLRYYDKYKSENLIGFIKALDNKFAHDWLLGYTPTIRIENVNAIIQAIDDSTVTGEVIINPALKIESSELKTVFSGNIYGKRAARYVLLKLDLLYHGHTTKLEMPETISIEHILPQTPLDSSQWKVDFTDDERIEWTNKLGNLVLISRRKNSSQSNKDYSDKKEKYFKHNIELFSNSIRIFNQFPTWNLADVKKNQASVLNQINLGFGI